MLSQFTCRRCQGRGKLRVDPYLAPARERRQFSSISKLVRACPDEKKVDVRVKDFISCHMKTEQSTEAGWLQ